MKISIKARSWKTAVKNHTKSSLKNICAAAFVLMFGFSANVEGQQLVILPNAKYLEGDSLGKSYQIMLTSAVGKKQIVDDFISFLDEFGICSKKELQKRIDRIDDKTTDFTVDFVLPTPMFVTHVYGMSTSVPAVILNGKLQFQFNNDIVKIDFKNWSELTFQLYNDADKNFDLSKINPAPAAPAEKKGFFQQLVEENLGEEQEKVKTPKELALEEWTKYYNEKIMQNTVLYKSLTVASGILFSIDPTVDHKQMAKEIRDVLHKDWYANMDKEFPIYDKLSDLKLGKWFSDYEYLQYFNNNPTSAFFTEKTKKTMLDLYTGLIEEQHKLVAVTEARWEKQVRPLLSDFFKYLVSKTESKVLGVAEDGITTYLTMKGKILPVNPKWERLEDGTPILPADAILDKYIKKNEKNQY